MASSNRVRGVTIDQLLGSLINGVNTAFPSGSSLAIDGSTYDKAGLGQKLQQVISPFTTVEELRTQFGNAVKDRDASVPEAQDFCEKVVTALVYLFSNDANTLAKFGIFPPKTKRKLTAQEKVERAAKAKATRALRGTKGSRQLEGVKAKGDVSVSVTVASPPATTVPSNGASPIAPSTGSSGTGSTTAMPVIGTATSTAPAAAPNGATGPQEVNGAAH